MTTQKNAKENPFIQSHRQAPWRSQTQRLVIALMIVILGASTLWVMVSVTVEAGAAGLEIQRMEDEQEALQREIANLRTQYAILTSADRMSKEAEKMGFEAVKPENITYMTVPSFTGRQPAILAPEASTSEVHPLIKPGYTQSLWEWLLQGVLTISEQETGIVPSITGGSKP